MAADMDLRALEKRVYMSFHEDGIIDIFVGLLLILDGWLMLSGNPAFVGVAAAMIFLIMPVKKLITLPRMGLVKFSHARNKHLTRIMLLLLALGVLMFLLVALLISSGIFSQGGREHIDLVFGLMFALPAGVGVVLTGQKRYLLYVAGSPVLFLLGYLLIWPFPVILILIGALVMVSGGITLLQFLKKYPRPETEEGQRP